MAITIIQKPTGGGLQYNVYEANRPIIYSVEDPGISAYFYHKYVAQIYIGTNPNPSTYATPIEMRVKANSERVGIFDVGGVASSFLKPQFTPHNSTSQIRPGTTYHKNARFSIHEIKDFSLNTDGFKYMQIRFFNFYSTTASGSPTLESSFTQSDDISLINGHIRISDDQVLHNYSSGVEAQGVPLYFNAFPSTANGILSDCPTEQFIGADEFHTFSLFNGTNTDIFSFATNTTTRGVGGVKFEIYDENDSLLSTTAEIPNNSSNGGHGDGVHSSNNGTQALLYVGVGSGNLNNNNLLTGLNWAYYDVIFTDLFASANPVFKSYRFRKIDNCRPYEQMRLCWVNRYGAWDYYTFTMRNIATVNTKRKFYKPISGDWDSKNGLEYLPQHGGEQVYNIEQTETLKLETDYITQETALFLEQLFVSPFVGVIRNSGGSTSDGSRTNRFEMVKLTTNSYERKKEKNHDLIRYTITVEKSKSNYTQRV